MKRITTCISFALFAAACAAATQGKVLPDDERAARRKAIIAPVAEGVLRVRPTFAACGVCY